MTKIGPRKDQAKVFRTFKKFLGNPVLSTKSLRVHSRFHTVPKTMISNTFRLFFSFNQIFHQKVQNKLMFDQKKKEKKVRQCYRRRKEKKFEWNTTQKKKKRKLWRPHFLSRTKRKRKRTKIRTKNFTKSAAGTFSKKIIIIKIPIWHTENFSFFFFVNQFNNTQMKTNRRQVGYRSAVFPANAAGRVWYHLPKKSSCLNVKFSSITYSIFIICKNFTSLLMSKTPSWIFRYISFAVSINA